MFSNYELKIIHSALAQTISDAEVNGLVDEDWVKILGYTEEDYKETLRKVETINV